jgi:glycosyltransferase involved in cell wall biosynthesis
VKVSVVIITKNEEQKIAAALRSSAWADEIVVVDSGSSDRTCDIAKEHGARVIVREWPGFSEQKQFAVDSAKFDRVFSLDADEIFSDDLVEELKALKQRPDSDLSAGYFIPRLSYYLGKPIYHGGWYPDKQLRFFDRKKGRWNGAIIHEAFKLNEGESSTDLSSDLLHFSVESLTHHNQMIGERYAPLAAQKMLDQGKRTSLPRILGSGLFAFVRAYFLKAGFLDGFPGFCIAYFAAHHAFLKQMILRDLQKKQDKN